MLLHAFDLLLLVTFQYVRIDLNLLKMWCK